MIVALARNLLIAFWRLATTGAVPDGMIPQAGQGRRSTAKRLSFGGSAIRQRHAVRGPRCQGMTLAASAEFSRWRWFNRRLAECQVGIRGEGLRSNGDLQRAYAIMGLKPINSVPPLMAAFAQAAADVMADQRD
jgi:hypothetical protein